jgi:hypothetical protein
MRSKLIIKIYLPRKQILYRTAYIRSVFFTKCYKHVPILFLSYSYLIHATWVEAAWGAMMLDHTEAHSSRHHRVKPADEPLSPRNALFIIAAFSIAGWATLASAGVGLLRVVGLL